MNSGLVLSFHYRWRPARQYPAQRPQRPHSNFLADGEQPIAVNRRFHIGSLHCLKGRKHDGDTCLVVKVARDDKAIIDEFGRGIDSNYVTNIDTELQQIIAISGERIDTEFDMRPADRLRIDFLIECMAGSFQRQDRTAINSFGRKDGNAGTFGETR